MSVRRQTIHMSLTVRSWANACALIACAREWKRLNHAFCACDEVCSSPSVACTTFADVCTRNFECARPLQKGWRISETVFTLVPPLLILPFVLLLFVPFSWTPPLCWRWRWCRRPVDFPIPTSSLKIWSQFFIERSLSLLFVSRDVRIHPSLLTLESCKCRSWCGKSSRVVIRPGRAPLLSFSTRVFSYLDRSFHVATHDMSIKLDSPSNDNILLSSHELFGAGIAFCWTHLPTHTIQYFPILELCVLMLRWTCWIFMSFPNRQWPIRFGIQFATCPPLDLQLLHLLGFLGFWDQPWMDSPPPQQVSLCSFGCLGSAPLQLSLCSSMCPAGAAAAEIFRHLWELSSELAGAWRVFDTKFCLLPGIPFCRWQSAGTESWTMMAWDLVCQNCSPFSCARAKLIQ